MSGLARGACLAVFFFALAARAGEPTFVSSTAMVRAMVIVDGIDGTRRSQAVVVKAEASSASGIGATTVRFASSQPPALNNALPAVVNLIARDRAGSWVPGQRVTVEIGERLNRLDAESVMLALHLALDGLATGKPTDSSLALAGSVDGSGVVRPVESLGRKIRESAGLVRVLVVPAANREDLSDLLVTDGLTPWLGVQVFTAETLDDVRRLVPAPEQRDAVLNETMRLFDEIRGALGANPRSDSLRQESIHLRLRKILELEPGHVSARMVLAVAEKRIPSRLSMRASLRMLDGAERVLELKDPNELFQAANTLNRQRPILAPEVQVVWDTLAAQLEAKRRLLGGGLSSSDEWKAKAKAAEQAFKTSSEVLALIPEVQEARERLGREP